MSTAPRAAEEHLDDIQLSMAVGIRKQIGPWLDAVHGGELVHRSACTCNASVRASGSRSQVRVQFLPDFANEGTDETGGLSKVTVMGPFVVLTQARSGTS